MALVDKQHVAQDTMSTPAPSAVSGTYPTARHRVRDDADRSLDEYDPEEDVVAPISVRTSFMELLWICGDCGEHYPRATACPEHCQSCGAPKQHFYAPLED